MNFALRDSLKHTPAQADDYLASLNAEQRAAVEHGDGAVAGPLLVIAGAGSGKTNTLAHRVAHLIVKGADPRRILLMTFSRRAASEMKIRVERIAARVMGDKAAALTEGLTWAGTFHAIGARLLRDYALEIGLDPAFTIHDREDSADLMNLVRHELGLSKTESRFPAKGTCLAIYSRVINAQGELEPILAKSFPWCIGWADELKQLFAAYVDAKQAHNVLDYDDLLLWWAQICGEPAIAEHLGGRFDHILVDEYQDTNRLQASILLALKPDGRGLTVVGDDAQSIYSFRAAEVRNILDFPAHFTEPARVVTLDRNYRSTDVILEAANAVIGEASERFTKNLWTERASSDLPRLVTVRDEAEQASYVADMVLEAREEGVALKSQAVLFRAAHHSGPLEIELKRPLTQKQIWAIRFFLDREGRIRDRALFDIAIDSKLRGCDLVKIRISDVVSGPEIRKRAIVVQQKTGRPVQFEITSDVRASLLAWLERRGGSVEDYVFPIPPAT